MDDITRREALLRLKRTLNKKQIEDLQIVIKNTKVESDLTGVDSDGGSFWEEENASKTLNRLAAELNFDNDAFDVNSDEDIDDDDDYGSEAQYSPTDY